MEDDNREPLAFALLSPAFEPDGKIPSKYTCDGDSSLSPPLTISNVPEGTVSLALIMVDPDIPQAAKDARGVDVFDHWVVYGIPPGTVEIPEGGTVGSCGVNTIGKVAYAGPCPPPEYEPREHRYVFTLYALSGSVHFDEPPTRAELEAAIRPLVIKETHLIGRYARG